MKINYINIKNFRNIKDTRLTLEDGVNIFCGLNGQGKTNLLEAMWLLTGEKSFRSAKNNEMIAMGCDKAVIEAGFNAAGRDQSAVITVTPEERGIILNDVKLPSPGKMMGNLCAVVFSPEHMKLINETAQERRLFLDAALCQARPSYTETLIKYKETLAQKNWLCKYMKQISHLNISDGNGNVRYNNEVWCETLSIYGSEISYMRAEYVKVLSKEAARIYAGISGEKEKMSIEYKCSYAKGELNTKEDYEKQLYKKLYDNIDNDMRIGYTYYGSHRDDLEVKLDGKSVRQFGSQGQKRSCVLALKLAQASLSKGYKGEMPVAVLDDVLSELDEERQGFLLSKMKGWQVMITCCEEAQIKRVTEGKVFYVANGEIK